MSIMSINNYEDATQETLTRKEVKEELKTHGFDMYGFVNEYGEASIYSGQDVLDYLGY